MEVNAISAAVALVLAVLLAAGALTRRPRNPGKVIFAAGFLLLAAEILCLFQSADTADLAVIARWQHWRMFILSLVPGIWLLFSLVFARGNSGEFVRRWRWLLVLAFAVPLSCAFLSVGDVRGAVLLPERRHDWAVRQSPGGLGIAMSVLISSVLVVLNLEKTFREARGTMRWRIKYVVLALGLLFAMRFYTSSQVLLYRMTTEELGVIDTVALAVACCLVAISFFRPGVFNVDVYPSHAILRNTITMVLAGGYLILVGVIAIVVEWRGGMVALQLKALYFLIALVVLVALLLSDRVRLRIGQFVSRHLRRSRFDYREVWRTFTKKTAAQVTTAELCRSVATWVSANLDVLSVTLWLVDESNDQLAFGASTAVPEPGAAPPGVSAFNAHRMIESLRADPEPVNLDTTRAAWAAEMRGLHPAFFPRGGNRYCVPMACLGRLVGLMTLGDRVRGVPFSHEELDLLKCVGEQAASSLLNLRLSERLLGNREIEAFQTMSTFFAHDLKNTVSTLSLTVQNLPKHFADPAFREDALRGLSRSVQHMQQLIQQLTLLRQKLEIRPVLTDLNHVVSAALESMSAGEALPLARQIGLVPQTMLDPEQVQRVIVNLLLNAREALNGAADGRICLATSAHGGWVELAVSDNGCGMTAEFLQRQLFRPFQTTKKNGTGIGMFHSKMIVDAHHGRFEVTSEVGKGSTFRILLPIVEK